jgi:hypothetical protein
MNQLKSGGLGDKSKYQSEIDKLQLNIESVVQKVLPTLDFTQSSNVILGSTASSVIVSVPANEKATKTAAVKNNVAYAELTSCIDALKEQYSIADTSQLRIVFINKDNFNMLQNNAKLTTTTLKVSIYLNGKQLDTKICQKGLITNVRAPFRIKNGIDFNRYLALKNDSINSFDPSDLAFTERCFQYIDKETGMDTTLNFRRQNVYQGYQVKCMVREGECTYTDILDNSYIGCSCNNTNPTNDIYGLFSQSNLTDFSNINFDVFACAGESFVTISP